MRATSSSVALILLAGAAIAGIPVVAQDDEQATPAQKSGYEDVPEFGGPSSVGVELKETDRVKQPWFRPGFFEEGLQPWFEAKERLNEEYGLSYGIFYQTMFQVASDSPGEDEAAGGIFQLPVSWTVFGRGADSTGTIVFKAEHRHRIGTDTAPQNLGFEAGVLGLTGTQFGDFDTAITNFYWQHRMKGGRLNYVAGRVDPTDYLDIYGLVNPLAHFANLSFSTNPTIPAPNQGFGAALGAMASERIYVVAGFSDANAQPTTTGFDSFFDDREYFKHVEVGWIPSFERRYFDNLHVTAWHVDEREDAGVPEDWGVVASFTRFIGDRWMPFVRAGVSDEGTGLMEETVSVGAGRYFSKHSDVLGFGVSWGSPPGALEDQYTAEAFYRLQLAPNLAVTPDVQLVVDPALDPDEDSVLFFGVRLRLTL
jgi:porin